MECTLKELVSMLSAMLKFHPEATICSYDDKLVIEDTTSTHSGGAAKQVFKITSSANKFFTEKECLSIIAC